MWWFYNREKDQVTHTDGKNGPEREPDRRRRPFLQRFPPHQAPRRMWTFRCLPRWSQSPFYVGASLEEEEGPGQEYCHILMNLNTDVLTVGRHARCCDP